MNTAMIKKVLNVGLIIGGLMMLVGGIIAVINVFSIEEFDKLEDFNVMFGWAIVTRIGAIIGFVLALALVGYAFLFRESNKIPAYVTAVAGVLGFVGQFLFNSVTGYGAMTSAIWSHMSSLFSSSDETLGIIQGPSATGLIFAIVAGIVMLAVGIMGLVKKSLPFIPYNNQPVNNPYGQPMNNQYGQPMNNQYAQPMNNQYAQPQPMNNQYAQPANNQYAQPMNNQYSQPINNGQYAQPTNVNPYVAPTNNPYEQQPTNNNPYDNNNNG